MKNKTKARLALMVAVVSSCFAISQLIVYYASPARLTDTSSIEQVYTILESEGGTYLGPVVDYVYSGSGEFQHLSGGTYEGSFKDSKREGEGTFTWNNGDTFEGTWENDKMKEGTYTFSDGRKYSGTFKNNKFLDGSFYAKNPPDNLSVASLSATYASGDISNVELKTNDGATFSGLPTGTATIFYRTGNSYSGEVVNGTRSGEGVFAWVSDGKVDALYKGQWKNGVMDGKGEYHYTPDTYPAIIGTFSNGVLVGTATYFKEEGNLFETKWENGRCVSVVEI